MVRRPKQPASLCRRPLGRGCEDEFAGLPRLAVLGSIAELPAWLGEWSAEISKH
jgi:hypothetical protein